MWHKNEALERLDGDEELLQELCQIFLEESPGLMEKLRAAVSAGDARAVMRVAHSLKGDLCVLAAADASQIARQLEDMGHDKNLSEAKRVLVLLEAEVGELQSWIKPSTEMLR